MAGFGFGGGGGGTGGGGSGGGGSGGGFGFGGNKNNSSTGGSGGGFGFGGNKGSSGGGFGGGSNNSSNNQQQQSGMGVGGFGSPPKNNNSGGGGSGGFGFGGGGGNSGSGGSGGGFGNSNQNQNNNNNNYSNQNSVTGQYLLQWDNAYNATNPDCKFRTFLYNMCGPGQSDQAILRERTKGAGTGVKEEQWITAKRHNPNRDSMYPMPTHFTQGLKRRVELQKLNITTFHQHLGGVSSKLAQVHTLQEKNGAKYKKLVLDQIMAERKLLALTAKVEVMRQHGLKLGQREKHSVLERSNNLLTSLRAPNKFRNLHSDLQMGLDATLRSGKTASRVVGAGVSGDSAGGQPTRLISKSGSVDANVLRDWTKFLGQMNVGLQSLQSTLEQDLEDLKAASEREIELQRGHREW